MSPSARRTVFLLGAVGFAALFLWGLGGLPPAGDYRGPYGNVLNRVTVQQRHVTDVVTAVNFDYRGIDTVGEEFILFAAVAGVALLLRAERDEGDRDTDDGAREQARAGGQDGREQGSEAVRALALALAPPLALFALYIIAHGQLTPGGGFQGGVILASAFLALVVGGDYGALRALAPTGRIDLADALGAAGFVVVGAAALLVGLPYLQNVAPLGPVGTIYSGGTIPLIDLAVGLEVGSGFLLILSEFLEQTLRLRRRRRHG